MALQDVLLLAVIAALAAVALVVHFRRNKAGKGCGGGCTGCPHAQGCGKKPPGA